MYCIKLYWFYQDTFEEWINQSIFWPILRIVGERNKYPFVSMLHVDWSSPNLDDSKN